MSTHPTGALFFWTWALFHKNNAAKFAQKKAFWTTLFWLASGVISSILVPFTGRQEWHVIIAGSFFFFFLTELKFITKVVFESYNTSSNQASA